MTRLCRRCYPNQSAGPPPMHQFHSPLPVCSASTMSSQLSFQPLQGNQELMRRASHDLLAASGPGDSTTATPFVRQSPGRSSCSLKLGSTALHQFPDYIQRFAPIVRPLHTELLTVSCNAADHLHSVHVCLLAVLCSSACPGYEACWSAVHLGFKAWHAVASSQGAPCSMVKPLRYLCLLSLLAQPEQPRACLP